jgi:transcription-repair coupling factor (superfamily II helicase)
VHEIFLVKTLPHLPPLFFKKGGISVSSDSYSLEIEKYLSSSYFLKKSDITFRNLQQYLQDKNFLRTTKLEEKKEFSIKGDIINLWPIGYEHPIRLEFFGEEVESIYLYDEIYGKKIKDIEGLILSDYLPENKFDNESIKVNNPEFSPTADLLKIIFTNSLHQLEHKENFRIIDTDFDYPQLFWSNIKLLENEVKRLTELDYTVLLKTNHSENLPLNLRSFTFPSKDLDLSLFNNESKFKDVLLGNELAEMPLPAGFVSSKLKYAMITDREIFGSIYLTRYSEKNTKSSLKTTRIKSLLRQLEGSIEIGDFVVHEDYGVAKYAGLRQEEVDSVMNDYLLLEYDKGDELYVPLSQVVKITKYIGNEGIEPQLTRLGRASWENLKSKIKTATRLIAKDLIEHYAKRELSNAVAVKSEDSKDYLEFVNEFPYVETEDQIRTINEVISDLENTKPMNRLVVGDVGFGKTEVILRAAFKVVENGGQVAILAPTTLLTSQHFSVFKSRFKNYPAEVKLLSRFNTDKENKEIIRSLNEGKVDIIIGTHRLLSTDVSFKNLQLLVVDEEQRFGVKQKEKIKKLNYGVHVLYVSATPIPRTLGMTLSSIQDISIITTAPQNRKPIKTELLKHDWVKVVTAIQKEIQRNGQIFFLHNEIRSIAAIKRKLEELLPGIKIVVAHGQMKANELDLIMTEFYEKKFDILLSTTIIENGLDLPNVNTIIINNAERFGLSQLYQLRGRVGRGNVQAYCYLLYKGRDTKPSENDLQVDVTADLKTKKSKRPKKYIERLETLVDNQDLGSGFRIASKDLEIRGSGSFLGEKQHGHIAGVGYALYVEMLSEEMEKLKELNQLSINNVQ